MCNASVKSMWAILKQVRLDVERRLQSMSSSDDSSPKRAAINLLKRVSKAAFHGCVGVLFGPSLKREATDVELRSKNRDPGFFIR